VKFLVDNQLPPALARFIQSDLGAEAAHVADMNLEEASDTELWDYASRTDSILISKDEDFVKLFLRAPTACFVWVRVGNCRRAFLLEVFRRMWPKLISQLERNDRFIEIR